MKPEERWSFLGNHVNETALKALILDAVEADHAKIVQAIRGKPMGVNVCPAAIVAAPVESVWEILSDTALYEDWWEARAERIVPEGKAVPGQLIYLETSGFGRKWVMTLKIERVNPEKHQILFHGELLGGISHNTITCTTLDAASCRVQYG